MTTTSEVRRRLDQLGLSWPPVPPRHEYLPFVAVNGLVYVSGHAPFSDGEHRIRGRVGDTLDLSAGRAAARLAVAVEIEMVVAAEPATEQTLEALHG